jgi:phosphate transport system substrate-binding protein
MKKLILAAVAAGMAIAPALAADQIRIVGSSTVYPFTTAVAEQFAKKNGTAAPIVESTGTGGGIKLFCQSDDPNSPDAVNASRPMKEEEFQMCEQNGVTGITPIEVGLDAIVVAHSKDNIEVNVTLDQLYRAVAKYVIEDGKFILNPNSEWTNSKGERVRMEILGPPPTSGTRDSFVELVVEKACKAAVKEAGITLSADDEKKYCKSIREDGVYVEAGENDNLIVQKLIANPDAFGIFGYSFLEQNLSTIKGASIDGVKPEYETIEAGQYPVARKLYVYFKGSHLESKPDLKKFMEEYQSEAAIGEEGYLIDKGLLPILK